MNYAFAPILLATLVAVTAFAQTQRSGKASDTETTNEVVSSNAFISVAEFTADNVIGYLGHPLGTVVRITGTAVDGDTTRRKRDRGKTLLEIHTVNCKN